MRVVEAGAGPERRRDVRGRFGDRRYDHGAVDGPT